jgi:hypothetical protein
VPLVEQELIAFPKDLSTPTDLSGVRGGGVNLLVNMMDTVIVGMVTPSSHYFRCPYSIYQLHYVILLFTLASGRYLVSYKTPITNVTNRF